MGKLIPRKRKTYEVKRIVHEIYHVDNVTTPDEARRMVAIDNKLGFTGIRILQSETVRRVK